MSRGFSRGRVRGGVWIILDSRGFRWFQVLGGVTCLTAMMGLRTRTSAEVFQREFEHWTAADEAQPHAVVVAAGLVDRRLRLVLAVDACQPLGAVGARALATQAVVRGAGLWS